MAQRTPLYDVHRRLGARMVDFAGWEMPVSYGDAADEHRAVRGACGIFDVSHMGQLRLRGAAAATVWQRLTTNDVRRLADGGAQYTLACAADGGIRDDLILYRLSAAEWLAIVNAGNTPAMAAWVGGQSGAEAAFADESPEWALLALQGPRALEIARDLARVDPSQPPFTIRPGAIDGIPVQVSRTGYTGEDGFEVLVPATEAVRVWDRLCDGVLAAGGHPAGLAARDTLRLEAALPLCGSDMGPDVSPLQAGLGWAVRFVEGNDFVGRRALEAERGAGVRRRLVCFELDDGGGVPRHGYEVRHAGVRIGEVTSGARSPSLGRFIGMGYVASEWAEPGTSIEVVVRGRASQARVVPRPFYRRAG